MFKSKIISLKKFSPSISKKSELYKNLEKFYCEILIDQTFFCMFTEIESKIIANRFVQIETKRTELQLLFEFDIKCDVVHVIFKNGFKIEKKRNIQYKKHLLVHFKQRHKKFDLEMKNYYIKLKK